MYTGAKAVVRECHLKVYMCITCITGLEVKLATLLEKSLHEV